MKPRDEKISGIYCISFIGSPKCYIGSSIDICKRGNQHYNSLLAQKHRNKKLQNAFNLFGKYSFCFTIIEKVPFIEKSTVEKIKELRKLEQDYLDSILLANTDEKYFRENSYNLSKLTVAGCSINSSKGKATSRTIPISVFDLNMNFIEDVISLREAERKYNVTGIHKCCKGLRKKVKNYIFRYKNDINIEYIPKKKEIKEKVNIYTNPIFEYDLDGNFIREWRCMEEATDKLKLPQGGISRVLSGEYNHVKKKVFRKEKYEKIEKIKVKPSLKIEIYSKDGELLHIAKSTVDASNYTKICRKKIWNILNVGVVNKENYIFKLI